MAETAVTSNLGWDNFYSTTTTGALTATTTTIPLATPPTPTEGFLVLDPGGANEIIFYNSVAGNSVVVPTTDDRGRGDSTAQAHSSGITVKMNTVGMMFEALQSGLGLSATFNLPAATVKNADLATSTGELGAAWQSWTPTFVNWTVGTGGSAGTTAKYIQVGKTVFFYIVSTLGTSGQSVGNTATFSLPVTAASGQVGLPLGDGFIFDAGASNYDSTVWLNSTTTALILAKGSGGSFVTLSGTTSTNPITWAAGDTILYKGYYEAA